MVLSLQVVLRLRLLFSRCTEPSSLLLVVSASDDGLLRRRFEVMDFGRSFPSPFDADSMMDRYQAPDVFWCTEYGRKLVCLCILSSHELIGGPGWCHWLAAGLLGFEAGILLAGLDDIVAGQIPTPKGNGKYSVRIRISAVKSTGT